MQGIRSPSNRGEPFDDEVKPNWGRGVMKQGRRGVIEKAQGEEIC
jgi:hypothetical protein